MVKKLFLVVSSAENDGRYAKEMDDFVESQLQFMEEANKQIHTNAIEFHNNICETTDPEARAECEAIFISIFLRIYGDKVKRKIGRL